MAIRMGVIGGGIFGETHLQIFTQMAQQGQCVLAGLADLSEKTLAQRKSQYDMNTYTNYKEMLAKEKLDGVAVVTPDPTHLPIVLDALEAGCHVLVEKPMDVTVEGCEKMVETAKRKGRLLQVDFHKRFDPYHVAVRDAIAEGQMGTPLYGYVYMENRIQVPRDWWPAWVSRSSSAWFLGSHMIDLFRWLIGGRNAVRVYASGVKKKLVAMGIDTYDCIQAKVDFEGDIACNLDTGWVLPDGFEAAVNQGIRIIGTDGIVEIDSQNRGAETCFSGKTHETINMGYKFCTRDKQGRPRYDGYGFTSIADVVENIAFLKNGGRLEDLEGTYPSGEDGLQVTRIICAIHESLRTHKLVEL